LDQNSTFWEKVGPKFTQPFGKRLDQNSRNLLGKGWTKIHATFWENIKAEFWNGFCHAFSKAVLPRFFKSGFATLFSKAVLPRFFQKRFCHAFFKSGFATLFSKAVLPRFLNLFHSKSESGILESVFGSTFF
jgi:hypothetical protein